MQNPNKALSKGKPTLILLGAKYDLNIGDYLLGESLEYLLGREAPEFQIMFLDYRARESFDKKRNWFADKFYEVLSIFHLSKKFSFFLFKVWKKRKIYRYFEKNCFQASGIIFAGGGIIEYKHYDSDLYIESITKVAEKYNIPIVYNAVGILDKFDKNNKRSKELKKALESPCVKWVGVRENVDWIKTYTAEETKTVLVCDPACWSAEAYGVSRDARSDLIGIGLIRPTIFTDFGIKASVSQIVSIYGQVIGIFIKKGFMCELFSNGNPDDIAFGENICKRFPEYGLKTSDIKIPKTAKELLQIESRYKLIFGSRLHCAIVSFSLGIPCGTLCWNPKIEAFYKNVRQTELCFFVNTFDAKDAVAKLLRQEYIGDASLDRAKYLNSAIGNIRSYIQYFE